MLLAELIKGLDSDYTKGSLKIEIAGVAYDSRKVVKDTVFVCIDGTKTDGHDYIPQALQNGASAVVVQKDVQVPEGITVIRTQDTRYALAYISDAFFRHPSGCFRLIGVTGTKGKTTTTYMIKSILEASGKKTGLVGTLGSKIGDREIHTDRTTPESYELQAVFAEMLDEGAQEVVMEVSSQGLALKRVSCCEFDIGVFTNFSEDHIGPNEHASMDEYLNAKIKLFKMCKKGIVNIDSSSAQKVIDGAECPILSMGINNAADIKADNLELLPRSAAFDVTSPWYSGKVNVNIPGRFTVYNALAAIGVCGMLGIDFEAVKKGLESVQVPGRAEIVPTGREFSVIIDYAHTPDSLENILSTVKDYARGRVISVFGCGGDRDRTKRPVMGGISGRIADFTVITSDNPRTEVPESIVDQIEEGITKTNGKYIKIVDRREAIKYALANAAKGDVVVLSGKGHETYQEFGYGKIHFDEREVVSELLKELFG